MQKFKRTGGPVDVPALGLTDVTPQTIVEVPADLVEGFEGRDDWEHIPDPKRSAAAKKAAAKNDDKTEES